MPRVTQFLTFFYCGSGSGKYGSGSGSGKYGSGKYGSGKYGSGKYGNAREHTKYTFLTQEIYATCKISYQKTFHNRNQNQRISYITLPPFKLYYYPPFSFPFSAFFGDGNTLQRP
ncbi:hypothetical protein GBB35_12380 [Bifidobacterium longum]|nr:hypothetical protein GBB35_12380 [Bifidobacterium longum]